jgi:hypothetical protein
MEMLPLPLPLAGRTCSSFFSCFVEEKAYIPFFLVWDKDSYIE